MSAGRKIRLHQPSAIRNAAEQVVRDAFAGKRPTTEAAALVAALAALHGMRRAAERGPDEPRTRVR